jgi:tetratricopeptide (TPR) repeat protein
LNFPPGFSPRKYERRPSITYITSKIGELVSLLSVTGPDDAEILHGTGADDFLQYEKLLGTDVMSMAGLRLIRWDKGLPGGTYEQNSPTIDRWQNILEARLYLLGSYHINTLWAFLSLGWSLVSAGRVNRAIATFKRAREITEKINGDENLRTWSVLFALAWTHADAAEYETSVALFQKISDSQRRVLGGSHPTTLSSVTAKLRTQLMDWQNQAPIEGADITKCLDDVRLELRNASGEITLEEVEVISLSAIARLQDLFHRGIDLRESKELFEELSSFEIKLFGFEHPILLTLSGLAWTYLRQRQSGLATAILHQISVQHKNVSADSNSAISECIKALEEALGMSTSDPNATLVEAMMKTARGNNAYGARGTPKCYHCRRLKRRVLPLLQPQLTFISVSTIRRGAPALIVQREGWTVDQNSLRQSRAVIEHSIQALSDLEQSILGIFLCLLLDRLAHPRKKK